MKTTLKILTVIFTVITLTSCGSKGVDQATKDAIAKFDTDWSAMLSDANAFVASLQSSIDEMKANHESMRTQLLEMTEEQMFAMRTSVAACGQAEQDAKALHDAAMTSINEWSAAQTDSWTEGTGWEVWKKDVEENKVKQEDATKLIDEWNAKLEEDKGIIKGWQEQWATMDAAHKASEVEMASMHPEM